MIIALISDIHGNLPALEAVLKRIDSIRPDAILCMGDLVGYGPQPNEVIDIIRQRNIPCVEGNHDAAITGRMPMGFFREPNQSLLKWTAENLSEDNLHYIKGLPLTWTPDMLVHAGYNDFDGLDSNTFIVAHASPVQPERWSYLNSAVLCRKALEVAPQTFCFVGHTHVPGVVANELGVFGMESGFRYIVNPGAVGQSRDSDKRASFGVLDTEAFSYTPYRTDYTIERTLAAYDLQGYEMSVRKRLLNI
jgi:predicted phosphodiesterase